MSSPNSEILRHALPPTTDYITYLTLIEYNLTLESLPVLNEILQDAKLTANIGWDLISLLLPLLPASQACLDTVARLGNPREVILKVTEALRLLEFEDVADLVPSEVPSEFGTDDETQASPIVHCSHPSSEHSAKLDSTVAFEEHRGHCTEQHALAVTKFEVLLCMLSTLHPRIKTRYPSRFLATSMQAVLAAAAKANAQMEVLAVAMIQFLMRILKKQAPQLPPRTGQQVQDLTGMQSSFERINTQYIYEGETREEGRIKKRLMDSFLTYVTEFYASSLSSGEYGSGLAMSARMFEILYPEKIPTGKVNASLKPSCDPGFLHRLDTASQLTRSANQLGLDTNALLAEVLDSTPCSPPLTEDEEERPPERAEDIPLSNDGAIILMAESALLALSGSLSIDSTPPIFPTLAALLKKHIPGNDRDTILLSANVSASSVDAIVALCLHAVRSSLIGQPTTKDEFASFLRSMSTVSATVQSESLRYHAYYVTSSVLRANPSDVARFTFICENLVEPTFDNLKVAAVTWLKDEVLRMYSAGVELNATQGEGVFAVSNVLHALHSFLFPDPAREASSGSVVGDWPKFKSSLSFYLASLNFYYLLLSSSHLKQALEIHTLDEEHRTVQHFVSSLQSMSEKLKFALLKGSSSLTGVPEEDVALELDLQILDDVLERVSRRMVESD